MTDPTGFMETGSDVGNCLLSQKDLNEDFEGCSSDDQDQFDIIEEQINKKINCLKDLK